MSTPPDLDTLRDMLPFYVNGTLGEDDKAAFEAGLARHPELQAELDAERELQSRFNAALDEEIASVGKSGAHTADVAIQSFAQPSPSGLAQALAFLNPVNWKPAVTLGVVALAFAQTAVIGGQATMIASLEDKNYALASGLEECNEPADLIVTLSDDAAWGDVMALFNSEKLQIIGGTTQGLLEVDATGDRADIAKTVERLQANEAIASVYEGG